uniref:serine protease inhibitor Kazal-type 1-like n=1 Tax=Scatophagus argus TaxID=75038 RepID=UPI001ED82137|nr:serine protease inhibitor Kazal-type 1-like [Scatophagus argus]XP_046242339.1 serine protease inhibitor Kazal-type 1-like [Scatophagus argus]
MTSCTMLNTMSAKSSLLLVLILFSVSNEQRRSMGKVMRYVHRGCLLKFRPVCGSDGITYISECVLREFNRKTGKKVVKLREGLC